MDKGLNWPMNKDIKKKWVEALRSDAYQQTHCRLQDKKGYCCLGVLHLVTETTLDYGAVYDLLSEAQAAKCMNLNDSERWNFKQIADYIEAHF